MSASKDSQIVALLVELVRLTGESGGGSGLDIRDVHALDALRDIEVPDIKRRLDAIEQRLADTVGE